MRRIGALTAIVLAAFLLALPAQTPNIPLFRPAGIAYTLSGTLYLSEAGANQVRKWTTPGTLSIVAGTGVQGWAGDGGPASLALLDRPGALAVDPQGNLYIADTGNHCVRRVDATTLQIATVMANLDLPSALAFDSIGRLLIADSIRHTIVRLDVASGIVSLIAGDGTQGFRGDGGPASAASLDSPSALAFDARGNLLVADAGNHRIRRVDGQTGTIGSVAGNGSNGFTGEGGKALSAAMTLPRGLTVDAAGNVFFTDLRNHRVRRIDAATDAITTAVGNGTQAFTGDGGSATAASLDSPTAVTLTSSLLTLSDTGNNRVRRLDRTADIQTIAGPGATVPSPPSTKLATAISLSSALAVHVSAGTGPSPTGNVNLLEGPTTIASLVLSSSADGSFAATVLSSGSHTLRASYLGDTGHAASVSLPQIITIGPVAAPDFSLSAVTATVTVSGGTNAIFNLMVAPVGSALSSPILLSASGGPTGGATFNPGYVVPSSTPTAVILTLTTLKAEVEGDRSPLYALACVVGLLCLRAKRRRLVPLAMLMAATGCGDRVNQQNAGSPAPRSYNLTVTGTATTPAGTTLLHTVDLVLTVQ